MDRPVVAPGHTLVTGQPPCVRAVIHPPRENPFLPVAAADDRGSFFGLDYSSVRPWLVEVIHSEPHVVRGNHIHLHCTEIFTVLSGELGMYLLCTCPEKHLLEVPMTAGMTVTIHPGTAHAIFTRTSNESVAVFGDGDPRDDRARVTLLE